MARLKAVPFQNSGTFSGPKGRVSNAVIFHGLKPVASTAVPLTRDPFAQGIKTSVLLARGALRAGDQEISPACTGALCAGDRDITPACAGARRARDQEIQSCLRGSASCRGSRDHSCLCGSTSCTGSRDPLLLARERFVQGIKTSSPACAGALCAGDQDIQSHLRGTPSCRGSRDPVPLARDPFAQGIKSSGQSARPGSSWPVTSICWFWKALSSSVVPVSRNELVWRAAPFSTAVMT